MGFHSLHNAVRFWVWAGIQAHPHHHFSPIRLTNILSLLVLFMLLLQLPLALLHWQAGGQLKTLLIGAHLLCLPLVILCNLNRWHSLATLTLVIIYCSYILFSSLLWQVNLNTHFFMLLGISVTPLLFLPGKELWVGLCLALMSGLFAGLELFWLPPREHLLSSHQAQGLHLTLASLLLASLLSAWHIRRNVNNSWRRLANEQQKTERLLLNMLPAPIAHRLKYSKQPVADYFEQVTILFADITDFTAITRQHSPGNLVKLLNEVFSMFDRYCDQYGLEKIKTIGDEYMAVAGVPVQCDNHAIRCCQCAIAMRDYFHQISDKYQLNSELRIGIASGEVVAGVIGRNKFSYDLWGEAVNLASRMESHGQRARIQVTHSTYLRAQDKFNFHHRGNINVKGIGTVQTYWLE